MSEDGYLPLHKQEQTEPLYVVPKDLCTRCGACDPICPVDCISFDERGIGLMEFAYSFTLGLVGAIPTLAFSTALLLRAKTLFHAGIGSTLSVRQ